jgi:tetratricopeptide (TPR) repeat protein
VRLLSPGRVVFVATFALYVACAAPGLYLRDSGELTTAAFTLGIAHETGFALWCLWVKALTFIPLGEVATRVSVSSALAAATAAWLAFRAVVALAPGQKAETAATAAGLGAAALTAAGLTMFRAATVAEVYATATAALAAALILWTRAAEGDRRAGLMLALLGGLSLGLHAQVRLLVGPAAIILALVRLRRGDRWPLVAPTALALGTAVVCYMPLRAARAPAANWADPRTLGALGAQLSAARIRRAFAGEMFHDTGAHLVAFARQMEGQLGLVAILVALGGLVWLLSARARRPLGVILVVVLVGDALYSSGLNPMAIDDLQVGHPTALALAIAAGAGVLAAARQLGRAAPWAAAALAVLITVPAAFADVDAKLGLGPEASTWATAALDQAPPRALLLVQSDDLAAGSTYEQYVAGARPDVTLLVRQIVWDQPETAARMRRGGGELHPDARLRKIVDEALPARAVLWEPGQDSAPLPLEPDVPLYRLRATPAPLPSARPLAERVEQLLLPARDPTARHVLATQLTNLGRIFFQRGDLPRATALFEAARAVRPGDAVAAIDLAVIRARQGDLLGALALVDGVLEREPERLVARLNAGRYRLRLGDFDGAAHDFAQAQARAPLDPAPIVGLARVAQARADRAGARRLVQQAQKLSPDDPEARALGKELDR